MIEPGATIGILGGGQLGRMLAHAAQSLGYRAHVYEPSGACPAAAVADAATCAPYEDTESLRAFGGAVDVVTYEFENIPAGPLSEIAGLVPLHPSPDVLRTCQNRQREKAWLKSNGFPHVPYAEAVDGDLARAVAEVGFPCVVKTADFGYDGKGQLRLSSPADAHAAAARFRGHRCVVERWVEFEREISVVCARTESGETRPFPVSENLHVRHILDRSIVPARIGEAVAREAADLASRVAGRLGVVGMLAVEMFVLPGGALLVNELAPRTHNSGHWSLDGCPTSQFEQQVRAVCGLPLGAVDARGCTVMVNILGDAWTWRDGAVAGAPDWTAVLREPGARLHLYGKPEPRPGRKMGHFTVSAPDPGSALAAAARVEAGLRRIER